jgi:hypothetical protein
MLITVCLFSLSSYTTENQSIYNNADNIAVLSDNDVSSLNISYEMIDKSIRDEGGNTLGIITYLKPIFSGDADGIDLINEYFEQNMSTFLSEDNVKHFSDSVEVCRQRYGDEALIESPLYNTSEAKVTYNARNRLSIVLTTDWMAGGVRNINYYGFNFDIRTGAYLLITSVLDKSIAEINDLVVSKLECNISDEDSYYKIDDIIRTILAYKADDYNYYFDEMKIYVILNWGVYSFDIYILSF